MIVKNNSALVTGKWNVMKRAYDTISGLLRNEVLWILIVCTTFRNIYRFIYPQEIWWYSDTATYYYASSRILHGAVDAFRTPAYPAFLKLIELISNRNLFKNVVVWQSIISIISIIPFFLLCRQWFRNKYIAYTATILFGCLPVINNYNLGICPESLLISFLAFALYQIANYIKSPGYGRSVALNCTMVFLVMLKPVCIYLFGIIGLVWVLWFAYEKKGKHLRFNIAGLLVSTILISGYCFANKKQNGCFNLSSVNHDNNFANIILSDAYKTLGDTTFISIVDSIKSKGHYYAIYYLNNDYQKYQQVYGKWPKDYAFTRDMTSVSSVPPSRYNYSMNQLDSYIREAMLSKIYLQYIFGKFLQFAQFKFIFIKGYILYALLLVSLLITGYGAIYLRRVQWMEVYVVLALAGWLFTIITTGIKDITQERVLTPALPFIIILAFSFIDKITVRIIKPILR